MKHFFILFLIFFLGLFLPSSVSAVDYYVSATGSSTGSCTMTTPCTFSRAQAVSLTGDTITIQGKIGAIVITKPGLTVRGGVVDGSNVTTKDSAAVLIGANNTTLEDIEIINGYSYGFRTANNINNTTARRLNIHHNVRENFSSGGGCNTSTTSGWGSAMRAYFADGMILSDSYIWENCGEGFSAVMSKNIRGERLTIWDNWSVEAYPDQTDGYSLKDSSIYCIKPEFQRFTRNRSMLMGAESGYGTSVNITKNITITDNKIYNCRGLASYSQTSGGYENITVINNIFYNNYDAVIGSVPGTNIITSPNTITTLSPVPAPILIWPLSSSTQTSTPAPILKPADANNDGQVNDTDYSIWKSNYGQTVSGPSNGDFNNNGKVDGVDYVIWRNGYGK